MEEQINNVNTNSVNNAEAIKKQNEFIKTPAKKSDDFSILALILSLIPPLSLAGLVLGIISYDYLGYTQSLDIKHKKMSISAIVISCVLLAVITLGTFIIVADQLALF